jgi:predicted TPR repeat methyltransferase
MVNKKLLELIREEPLAGMRILDVGCGSGALALELAPHARFVVGIDISAEEVDRARRLAKRMGRANVAFCTCDALKCDYSAFAPDMVVAHFFMDDAVVVKSARALERGECLCFACIEEENLREIGWRSRFAYSERGMRRLLAENGFAVEHLVVERETLTFDSPEDAVSYFIGFKRRWREEKWRRLVEYFKGGGRRITLSTLVGKARLR